MTDFIDFKSSPFKPSYIDPEYKGCFRYLILDKIGRGSFGKVYRVMNTTKKTELALKLSSRFHEENQKEIDNYLFFSRIPRYDRFFPKVYQIFSNYNNIYIVMEYVQGGHMDNRLISIKKLSFRKVVPIIKHLVKILNIMHKNKRVLNDLKPDNVMVNHLDGKPRIIDLGLVTTYGDPEQCFKGSPSYMAPECFSGISSNNKKDIWALGITIFELITGHNYFEGLISQNSSKQIIFDAERIPEVLERMSHTFIEFCKGKDHSKTLKKIADFIFDCLQPDHKQRPSARRLLKHKLFEQKIKPSQYKGSQYFTRDQFKIKKIAKDLETEKIKLKNSR